MSAPAATSTKKLTEKEQRFVVSLCADPKGNAAKAAEDAGYAASSAKVTACRLLKKAHIKAALVSLRADQVSQVLQTDKLIRARIMDGDEALGRLSVYARADIGQILGPDDALSQLPDDVRATIKSVRPTRYGRVIELYDAMKATELMAKAGGKLKEIVQVESLETLIAKSMQPPAAGAVA